MNQLSEKDLWNTLFLIRKIAIIERDAPKCLVPDSDIMRRLTGTFHRVIKARAFNRVDPIGEIA